MFLLYTRTCASVRFRNSDSPCIKDGSAQMVNRHIAPNYAVDLHVAPSLGIGALLGKLLSMKNIVSFASLFAFLILTSSFSATGAFAQQKGRPKSRAVTPKASVETQKRSQQTATDVMGLQSIRAPQSAGMIGDTVLSRDGKTKVVNTPTGAYFIIDRPSASQLDTLNDWGRPTKRSERASDQKRR